MGVRASMSISLLRDDKLWGLIACHHYSGPHAPPYATRAAAEFLGSTLSLRLVDRAQEDEVHRALRVRSTLAWLTAATLDEDRPLAETLLGSPDLLDLLPADGVVVHLQGVTGSGGAGAPRRSVADAIAAWATGRGDDVVATDSLPRDAPAARRAGRTLACGVLVLPLPEGQYVLWCRGEAVQHIDWGGDPHNKAIAEREGDEVRLSPRKSFERWREIVRGRSEPWTPQEVAEAGGAAHPPARGALRPLAQRRAGRGDAAAQPADRAAAARPACELAVRYVPAAREAQVGGDWYDVFDLPDGSTILVIGDVVGHDTDGRGDAWASCAGCCAASPSSSTDGPAAVLTRLDRRSRGSRLGALATVLVGRLERPEEADGATRLRWASAGHLPPLLRGPDGEAGCSTVAAGRPAARRRPDAGRGPSRRSLLEPGSTLLLYTDGLVERRDQVFDDGVDAARPRPWATCATCRSTEMCDELLARLLPDGAEDDVALVAVCVRPCSD